MMAVSRDVSDRLVESPSSWHSVGALVHATVFKLRCEVPLHVMNGNGNKHNGNSTDVVPFYETTRMDKISIRSPNGEVVSWNQ